MVGLFFCTFWHFWMASQESVSWSRVKEGDLQGTFFLLLLRWIASETLDNLIPVLLTGRNFHLRTCGFCIRMSKVWALISPLNLWLIYDNCGRNLPLYFDTDRSSFSFSCPFYFAWTSWFHLTGRFCIGFWLIIHCMVTQPSMDWEIIRDRLEDEILFYFILFYR